MKILVIEDDADISSNIGQYFEAKGHELDFAYSGAHGLKLAIDERFDLIILDLMLPGKDGIAVCREFRERSKHDTPILMLTARDTVDDKISGFEAGTDDYLVKPFSLRELEVRVMALTRRGQNQPKSCIMRIDNLELNRDTMQVFRDNLPIKLKPKTFRILEYLMINPDRPLVIYESMSISMDTLDFETAELNLELQNAELNIEGKRGDARLNFHVKSGGTGIGHGDKTMLLSGLRPYDQGKIDKMVADYMACKQGYQSA